MNGSVCVFVQARMSSSRFPGKVLAPLFGRPLIQHVLGGVRQALPWSTDIVVVTSDQPSDDPLAVYVTALGVKVFRGALGNVFARFRAAMRIYPHEYVLRTCADSPFPNHNILRRVAGHAAVGDYDLVTTTYPRTFARGQNAELIRASTFLSINQADLGEEEREHVTAVYYRHPERYRILNLSSSPCQTSPKSKHAGESARATLGPQEIADTGGAGIQPAGLLLRAACEDPRTEPASLAVDRLDDLLRLERFTRSDVEEITRVRHRDIASTTEVMPPC
jgi:spore coat polysaccharide biosynthesis protein SpsF